MKPWVKYVRIITNLLIFLATIAVLVFIGPKVLGYFMPFLIGWIVACIANPMVRFLEKRLKIVRKFSSAIIIVLVIALVCVGGYFLISQIIQQGQGLMQKVPGTYKNVMAEVSEMGEDLEVILDKLPDGVRKGFHSAVDGAVNTAKEWAKDLGKPAVDIAGRFAKSLPSVFIATIVSILSSYFFVADRDKLITMFKKVAPESVQRTWNIVRESFSSTVGGYFKAQFKIMGVVALILMAGFFIMDVDYAVLLGILIAFLDMLPFFGTGTALGPWAVYKILAHDYRMAIGLIILYAVSQVVRQLIQPKLIGDSVGLDPLPTLVLIYIGYRIGGFLGMIIAIPVAMIIVHLYRKGIFDGILQDLKEIVDDINRFRKRPEKQETEDKE